MAIHISISTSPQIKQWLLWMKNSIQIQELCQMEDIICTMDKISDNIEKIRKAIDLTYSFNSEDF